MKKRCLIALALGMVTAAWGNELPKDSVKVVDMEEVVVIATPKENRKLRELPIAATLLSQKEMQANHVKSVKNLTGVVPNLFIPEYGSKLTTSIYIRGIGSRINTPSVGLYVDNIPYIDKSAFDFNYADIERIDVLRGPQGTLYGRNTMAGLIKVHTKSPFTYQGTDLRMSGATYNDYNVSLTHYHRVSDNFAFSTGGFFEHTGGFYKNIARDNERVDRGNAGGGRFRGIYFPTDHLKVDMSLSYEYGDQGGYPYIYTGVLKGEEKRADYLGQVAYNQRSSYRRGLLNAGVNVEYQADCFILNSVTGYQNLNDRMFLDQDFTEADIYTLEQKQRSNTISEELSLKSKPGSNWQWTTGIAGFYQWLYTNGPVTFKEDGVQTMIEDNVNRVFKKISSNPRAPKMSMDVLNKQLQVGGVFDTPVLNGAVFHQSTFNNLFFEGFSATLGLRLDYEKIRMDYSSLADPMQFDFSIVIPQMPRPMVLKGLAAKDVTFIGKESTDYLQLLPKVALQYDWGKGNNVYATLSKGYRSGGYNIQMFSELAQGKLMNATLDALAEHPKAAMMKPMIEAQKKELPAVSEVTKYKPEYSWNYEIGSHLSLWNGRLWADLSAFYMDTHDQQISQFAESGLGRITVNAGKSRSYGAEIAVRASLTNALRLNAAYGYTYATFTDYAVKQKQKDGNWVVKEDYNGKYVPFVPKHTLNVGGEYTLECGERAWVNRVVLQANYMAAGRIYWTEQNNVSQSFYGTLNARLNLEKGNASVSFWARNLLDKEYAAFYFETMNKGFKQQGRPTQIGVDLRCRF